MSSFAFVVPLSVPKREVLAFLVEAESQELGLENTLKCLILFTPIPQQNRALPKSFSTNPYPHMLLKILYPSLYLFTALSGQWMLCNLGQGAAGPGCCDVHATGMLARHVQTFSADTPPAMKD